MIYADRIEDKEYIPNIVILFKGHYWAIRQPDSGLVIDSDKLNIKNVAINPTKVDPAQANTTINSYTFSLQDKDYNVTALFNGTTKFFQNEPVQIFIGRCFVDMPFSGYMPLPITYVKSATKDGLNYNFKSTEAKDRLNRSAFNTKIKSEIDILDVTTIIDADGVLDLALWPASGLFKLDDEFISYASIDSVNNRFNDCIRGEKNSVPVNHGAGETIYLVTEITENPVDIILMCLISAGGGGVYDVLPDGAGIDEALINIDKFEEIRDEFYLGQEYNLLLYGVENILKYLETEILYPNELRIISDNTAGISLTILNRRIFDDSLPLVDNDSMDSQPSYSVDATDITNVVSIEYDYSEGTKTYRKLIVVENADSIADFGRSEPIELQIKGIQETLDGAAIANNIAQRFITRFAYPKPEIAFTTHMNKSLIQLGEKIILESTQLPNVDTGELNFGDTAEVIEKGINWITGDVKYKIGFTSFTGIRECYLAPSDKVTSVGSQKILNVGAGRGTLYKAGWFMRLYDDTVRDYASSQNNEIASINGDEITFVNDWSTTLTVNHRIMFCDYEYATEIQKRYCYISDNGLAFSDTKKSYQITL